MQNASEGRVSPDPVAMSPKCARPCGVTRAVAAHQQAPIGFVAVCGGDWLPWLARVRTGVGSADYSGSMKAPAFFSSIGPREQVNAPLLGVRQDDLDRDVSRGCGCDARGEPLRDGLDWRDPSRFRRLRRPMVARNSRRWTPS
jgi:hypothetical protein